MRVQCPSCDTRLRVTLPDDDTRVECPKCGTLFRPRDPDDEEDAPAPKKRGKKKAKEKKAFPVAQVVGTAVAAVVAIGAVVWVVSSRPKAEPAKPAPEVAAEAKTPDAPR